MKRISWKSLRTRCWVILVVMVGAPLLWPRTGSALDPPDSGTDLSQQSFALEYDTDRPGADYRNFDLPQAGPSSCCVSGVKAGGPSVPHLTGQPTGMNCPPGTTLHSGRCVSVGPPPEVRPPVVDPSGHPLGMNCPPGTMALGGQCVSTNPPPGIPPLAPLGP